ncbi:MAG: Fe-S-binding domain-containing protein, partial [Acidimicrobiia bacterium]
MNLPILSIITYVPLAGALLIIFLIHRDNTRAIKLAATVVAAIDFALTVPLWFWFDRRPSASLFQFVEKVDWIPSLGVQYHFGIDGIALLLVLMTNLMSLIAVYSSYT